MQTVTTTRLDITGGSAAVPDAPGLGVKLDPDRLADAAKRFEAEGFYSMFDENADIVWVPAS